MTMPNRLSFSDNEVFYKIREGDVKISLKSFQDNQFDDDAIEMLSIGQVTADRLTHNDDPIAWSWAKRDMVNFFLKARKEEIAQRNLQAGH
jgi:hypothetical protein